MFNDETWESAQERQEDMEDFSSAKGRERFEQRLKTEQESGRGSTAGAALKLLTEAVIPVEEEIERVVAEYRHKPGPNPVAVRWIEKVGVDVAAFLTVRVILDGIHQEKLAVGTVADHITLLMTHELRYRRFREEAPALFHYKMDNFDTTSYAHRSRSLNAAMRYAEVDTSDLEMSPRHKTLTGTWLIHKFIAATGLVEFQTDFVGNGSLHERKYIVPTEGTREWIDKRNDALAQMRPVKMPMVVPPLRWGKKMRGGYQFALRNQYGLVRRWAGEGQAEDRDIPLVYEAVNRIQDTAWEINTPVYDLVREIERRGGGMADVPLRDNPPQPTLADTLASLKAQDPARYGEAKLINNGGRDAIDAPEAIEGEVISSHRHRLGLWHDAAWERSLEQLAHDKIMGVARHVLDEDAFWFPFNADFRGRLYPLSDYLSPQGSDLEKGLLSFADKKPMGAMGGKWLAIHLMNALGETPGGRKVSKMTLVERQMWVEDNEDLVLEVGRDPFGDRWWMELADEPFQFYAACHEWAAWADAGYSADYESGLPVAMDGSCNGLQHFAAAFRDEVGATAVNVTDNPRPYDVYDIVAEEVKDRVEASAAEGEQADILWNASNMIDRKLTKRPTMTFGYGSKPYGFTEQIIEYLTSEVDNPQAVRDHFEAVDTETGEVTSFLFPAAHSMAWHIWHSLKGVVVKAFKGMEWFQTCAREICRTGEPVRWTVPVTGFPVTQSYFKTNSKRIDTVLAGTLRIQTEYYEEDRTKVKVHEQVNGVAPNVIHSLDAAALMLTVVAASRAGIEAFGMVHDSYATVPGDAERLSEALRQAFVDLYRHPIMDDLYEQWQEQADELLPDPGVEVGYGRLDIEEVLDSDYFFA